MGICSNVVYSTGCRELSSLHLEILLPLLLYLGVHSAVSHFFAHFSVCLVSLPFLKYVFLDEPPAWLMDSAVSCSGSVGAGWNQLCPWPVLTGATPAAPHYQHLDTYVKYNHPTDNPLLNKNIYSCTQVIIATLPIRTPSGNQMFNVTAGVFHLLRADERYLGLGKSGCKVFVDSQLNMSCQWPRRPTASWFVPGIVWPAAAGKGSFPCTQHW